METNVARQRVCAILDAPRSTIYAREKAVRRSHDGIVTEMLKRGPKTELGDDDILGE